MAKGIYLDNSTTARPSERAISKMMPFFSEKWGCPTAPHDKGQELFSSMEESYQSIYKLFNGTPQDSFVLTSSGAEAVNHAILSSYFDSTLDTGRNHFITSNIDEAPAIMAIGRLEKLDCVGKMVRANKSGMVTAQEIADHILPRTALISLSWANGLTGVINPVAEIAKICRQRGITFHIDATHVLGKLYFDLDDIGANLISFNGDQLHAPKGTGGLYVKNDVNCSPFILGGFEQAGQRAGSLNVPGLVALGVASQELVETCDLLCTEVARLRNRLEEGITEGIPGAHVFFKDSERVPHITAIAFPGIANETMLYALNRRGIYASIGGGNFQQLALILENSSVEPVLAHSAVSFSLSRETTEDEIERTISIVIEEATKLQKLSQKL